MGSTMGRRRRRRSLAQKIVVCPSCPSSPQSIIKEDRVPISVVYFSSWTSLVAPDIDPSLPFFLSKAQMSAGTAEIIASLGNEASKVTTQQIQEALWHYYYDVDKSITYLINKFIAPPPKPAKKKPKGGQYNFSYFQDVRVSTNPGRGGPDKCTPGYHQRLAGHRFGQSFRHAEGSQ